MQRPFSFPPATGESGVRSPDPRGGDGRGRLRQVVVVGAQLAARLAVALIEGDDFHPQANIDKMREGVPLQDADRAQWLAVAGAGASALPGRRGAHLFGAEGGLPRHAAVGAARLALPAPSLTPHQALERVAVNGHRPLLSPQPSGQMSEALQDPSGEPDVHVVDASLHVDRVVADAMHCSAIGVQQCVMSYE